MFYICQKPNAIMYVNYFFAAFFFFFFTSVTSAQDVKQQGENLGFYPNPVSTGKIFITSKSSIDKEVVVFDVLGKKVLQATLSSKELNISTLSPGVYIIKIREGEATATRKLIVK